MPPTSDERSAQPRSARSRRVVRSVIALVSVLAVVYVGRIGWLTIMATEGDVPPATVLNLPAGSTIISEAKNCGSGGCWVKFTVQPPPGQTPESLVERLGATPQFAIPGNLLDPRTVWGSAGASGTVLVVTLDYWAGEPEP